MTYITSWIYFNVSGIWIWQNIIMKHHNIFIICFSFKLFIIHSQSQISCTSTGYYILYVSHVHICNHVDIFVNIYPVILELLLDPCPSWLALHFQQEAFSHILKNMEIWIWFMSSFAHHYLMTSMENGKIELTLSRKKTALFQVCVLVVYSSQQCIREWQGCQNLIWGFSVP